MAPREDDGLGDLALSAGLLTPAQLAEARAEQAASAEPLRLGQVLTRRGWLTTSQLTDLMQQRHERALPTDRYEIIDELGRGGMAVVYRARDRRLGREVALKVMRREFASSAATVVRMLREARAIAAIDHPNIVRLHDVSEDPQAPYLVMELLRGRTLDARLPDAAWSLRDRVALLEKVARAVEAAHALGIVHRDLKPGNIMIEESGRPVVMDFGLAHVAGGAEAALTRTGAVIGTPQYMAPEQVRGEPGEIDARTDVYALGAILYEVIAGRTPFRGTVAETYQKILTEDPAPPRRLNPRVPADLEVVCLRALAKEKGDRYAGAGAFAADLARYLAGEAVDARPISVWTRVGRRAMRRKGALAGGLLLLALAAGTVALLGALQRKEAALGDAQRRLVENLRTNCEASLDAALVLRRAGDLAGMRKYAERVDALCASVSAELPGLADPHYWRGRMLRARMRNDEALAAQEEALRRSPEHREARYERSLLRLRRYQARVIELGQRWRRREGERLREARTRELPALPGRLAIEDAEARRLRSLAEADLRGLETPVARALIAWLAGDVPQAQRLFEAAARETPLVEEPWEWLARIAIDSGDLDGAVRWYTGGLEQDRGYRPHLLGRGQAWGTIGDLRGWSGGDFAEAYGRAVDDYTKTFDGDPTDDLPLVYRAGTLMNWAVMGSYSGDDPSDRCRRALADLDTAIHLRKDRELSWAMRGHLRNSMAVHAKSTGHDPTEMLEAAAADFAEALRLDPDGEDGWLGLGSTHTNTGTWRQAIGLDPSQAFTAAVADFEKALRLNPTREILWVHCATARLNWALVRRRRGEDASAEFAAALHECTEALRLSPGDSNTLRVRGMVHLNRAMLQPLDDPADDLRRAIEDFSEVLQRVPKWDECWMLRGGAHAHFAHHAQNGGRDPAAHYEAALKDYGEALRLNPARPEAWARRGNAASNWAVWVLTQGGDPAELLRTGLRDLDEAVRLQPASALALKYRGFVRLLLSGHAPEDADRLRAGSAEDFAAVLRANPRDPDAFIRRAHANFNIARWREALDDYEKAAQLAPAIAPSLERYVSECRRRLGE